MVDEEPHEPRGALRLMRRGINARAQRMYRPMTERAESSRGYRIRKLSIDETAMLIVAADWPHRKPRDLPHKGWC